jgi:2-isopropylmalate synthase
MAIEVNGVYNWAKFKATSSPIRERVSRVAIDDETWRDGMQGTHLSVHPGTEQRQRYIESAARHGYIDHLDIGFPASGPQQRRQLIEIINFSQRERLGVTFSAAGRAAARGDVEAVDTVAQSTGVPVEADLFFDVSSLRAKVEGWDREEMIRKVAENIKFAKEHGLPVMFVPERASVTHPDELFEACRIAAEAGADRIAIADTTGVLTPSATRNLFRGFFATVGLDHPDVAVDFHEHNDLGMGTANCVVAAEEGVERLHATARGIGERAGNVALEQLLVVLNLEGFRNTDTRQLQEYTKMAAELLSVPIQSHEPLVGEESTATASGVHASTYGKSSSENQRDLPPIYFAVPPSDIGLEPHVKIGPMSGMANVHGFCREVGVDGITDADAQKLLSVAKERWALLSKEDVLGILGRDK